MTEAQVATLARHGVVPERDLTWVQASLLIDGAIGAPRGRQATAWLRQHGASPDEAASIVERAEKDLRTPAQRRPADAVDVRLEVLDAAASGGRRLSGGEAMEREALRHWQASAARARLRQRRQAWAQRAPELDAAAAHRAAPGRPARRLTR